MNELLDRLTQESNIIKTRSLTRKDRDLLNKAVDDGYAVKLKNGLYCPLHYVYNLSYDFEDIVPGGVLCLWSAWFYHDLCDYIPNEINIAVPAGHKVTVPKFPVFKLHYRLGEHFNIGITECEYNDDISFRIYDVERCVCDAFKHRNTTGVYVAEEILDNYMNREDKDIDKLMSYARQMKVEKIIKTYLTNE